jgi:hypothetical protein
VLGKHRETARRMVFEAGSVWLHEGSPSTPRPAKIDPPRTADRSHRDRLTFAWPRIGLRRSADWKLNMVLGARTPERSGVAAKGVAVPTEPHAGQSPILAEQQDSVAVVRDALREMSAGRRIDDADGAKRLPEMFSHQAFALRAALEANRTWGSHRPHG